MGSGISKKVDARQVRELAAIGCTDVEIGRVVGVSHDTLTRRYRAELDAGRADMRVGLRKRQIALAETGDKTMLIWLGKQYLGQTDKVESAETATAIVVDLVGAKAASGDKNAAAGAGEAKNDHAGEGDAPQ